MRWVRLALWPAGAVVGLAAESVAYAWDAPGDWVPDLATGSVLIACGLAVWSGRPPSRCGPLLAAAGFAWFAPNFAAVDISWIAWLSAHALYLHRGPLVQVVTTYPSGRPSGRLDVAVVSGGWVAALVTTVWESGPATIALALLLVSAAVWQWARASGVRRRDRLAAACATCAFSLAVAFAAAARVAAPAVEQEWSLLVYEMTLIGIALLLAAAILQSRPGAGSVTDLVVELTETRSGTHAAALAAALGDPSLELGHWIDDEQAYVDAAGRRLELPGADAGRTVTYVDRDGEAVAALVHDPAVLDDPRLVEAVLASAGLAASNARLHAEVREQAAAVEASRLRLLRARDDERRWLDLRLREGAERRLEELRPVLVEARRHAGPEAAIRVERAQVRLDATLADLRELASGLHPRELADHGLELALTELGERSLTPVRLELALEPLPFEIEAAIYFVCSEALANVVKYASAASVEVEVAVREAAVLVDVRDDGVGGADPAAGTGLAGLADRLSTLGGTLRIDSPASSGTRLHAELPRPPLSG